MTTQLETPDLTREPSRALGTNMLQKGPPGTHKTFNLLSWPGKTLLIYCDTNYSMIGPAIESGKVELLIPERDFDLQKLEQVILPKIRRREYDVQNVGVDTVSNLAKVIFRWTEGTKGATKHTWGRLKQVLDNVCWSLNSTVMEKPGKPHYNSLFTSHVKDIREGTGENVRVVRAGQAAIDGGFVDSIEGFFDNVFITVKEPTSEVIDGRVTVTGERFFCYTTPPTMKDTTKAEVKVEGVSLPSEVGGTYDELMKAWGIEI
jgi:hypothetical protein